jgi:hypothetical protein
MVSAARKKLAAIWTRDIDVPRLAGRPRIVRAIRDVMAANYEVTNLRALNLLERKSLRGALGACSCALQSMTSGLRPSCQCLLFGDPSNHREIGRALTDEAPDALYCDGVRTYYALKHLGDLRSRMKIVVDFDDLMSRRMESLASTDTALSFGYLHDKLPPSLRGFVALGGVSKAVAKYEQAALAGVEEEIGCWADVLTLVSSLEGKILRERLKTLGCMAEVHVIPPPMKVVCAPKGYASFDSFFFIGTDALPQNRLTIQRILDLWRRIGPSAEIHIFGHMVGSWPSVKGVTFRDYVDSLDEVYRGDVALLAPGVLRGGLKTKVAEAFARGCAVIGNEITFEGLELVDYPLLVDSEQDLVNILRSPAASRHAMRQAAVSGQDYIQSQFSQTAFEERWKAVLG